MTAMFDWSTFVAGAVGVVGIGGTLIATRMTSRSQSMDLLTRISADKEEARLAVKRRIYAECIAALNLMPEVLQEIYQIPAMRERLLNRARNGRAARDPWADEPPF